MLSQDSSDAVEPPLAAGAPVVATPPASDAPAADVPPSPGVLGYAALVSLIGVGSVCGVALREGLEEPASNSFYAFLFANFVGTGVLAVWADFGKQRWSNAVFVGVGTGFCGSLTTFSSWEEAAGVLVGPTSPDLDFSAGNKVYLWIQIQLVGAAVMLLGYDFGRHLWDALGSCKGGKGGSGGAANVDRHDAVGVAVGVCVAGVVASLAAVEPSRIRLAVCWGPFGAWLRWQLGRLNKQPRFKSFPIGTFAANMLGSALLAAAYVLGITVVSADTTNCNVLDGFMDGFCGSLTTVSTFVFELKHLPRKQAYIYGAASVLGAQALFVVIIGGFSWSDPNLDDLTQGLSCATYFQT